MMQSYGPGLNMNMSSMNMSSGMNMSTQTFVEPCKPSDGQLVCVTKRTKVPCTKKVYKVHKIKVPKVINEKVAKEVSYMGHEMRPQMVKYQVPVKKIKFRKEQ